MTEYPRIAIKPLVSNARCLYPEDRPKRGFLTQIGPIEANWRKLKPYFPKPVQKQDFVDPINALEDIEKFIARIEALNLESQRPGAELAKQQAIENILIDQEKEMASTVDLFRANGFNAISMSSSDDDDDNPLEIAEEVERIGYRPATTIGEVDETNRNAHRYGVAPAIMGMDIETAAAYIRRIEWERYALACSMPKKVRLTPEGGAVEDAPFASMPPDLVRSMGKRIKKAIENDWAYGTTTPNLGIEQSFDDLGPEEWNRPDENSGGSHELGLHNFADDDVENPPTTKDGRRINASPLLYEPNEDELTSWEMDIARIDAWRSETLNP